MLAAGAPEQTAFMSDEAMESVPGLQPIQYTAKNYALYLSTIVERSKKLNKGEVLIKEWSIELSWCTSLLKAKAINTSE